jgi:PleD family two-component response regulator
MGAATERPGERMESLVKRADLAMLDAKRKHYEQEKIDRRARARLKMAEASG